MGCSRRHLARRFAEDVGAPPKLAARLIRFEAARGRLGTMRGTSSIIAGDERAGSRATPPGASVVYIVVDDADVVFERATAAGAEVRAPVDRDYGSREVTVTDLEGNRWTAGTYPGAAAADG